MPKSQTDKVPPAKGIDASKSNTKIRAPAPYEFSGRDSISISSFDLAQVQESLEHSDVLSMRPQLKSPRRCPRGLNHPMHWQLQQHEFLIWRHKALRSSVPPHPSTLPVLEPLVKAPETLPLDESTSKIHPPSLGESSTASVKPPLPKIRLSPPDETSKTPRQPHPPIENPAYPWEEEELRALEELRNEQRRLHEETLDAMGEMAYWSFRAQRAANRVRNTMYELRSYMDEIRSGQEEGQGHHGNECNVVPPSPTK